MVTNARAYLIFAQDRNSEYDLIIVEYKGKEIEAIEVSPSESELPYLEALENKGWLCTDGVTFKGWLCTDGVTFHKWQIVIFEFSIPHIHTF